tara:strand:+ start:42 stop:512 length:471 start_codon:yes stop_codon:yes gene_type:complete
MQKDVRTRTAEQIYNRILKKVIQPILGDGTTYSTDLLKVCRRFLGVKFKGVFPSDKIPKLNDLSPYAILNLDNSNQSGSHWIAVAKIPNHNSIMCYDSFGRRNIKIIPSLQYSGNGRIIDTDRDSEQKITQLNCGERSISFLILFDKFGADLAKLI